MTNKEFVFLYPIPEIINFEVKNHGWHEKGGVEAFRKKYGDMLNKCIDQRYRQKGFGINWAIFDDCAVSEIIEIRSSDRIIKVGLDFKTHTTKKVYPNQDNILSQISGVRVIRIAGFHMWDCVEKLAKRAYEIGLDTLVDEDLTEFFSWRINDRDFTTDKYPTHNPRKKVSIDFMRARKQLPWLWQNY